MKKETKPVGRPRRTDKDNLNSPSAERGTIPGDKRKTYIVSAEDSDKLEGIATIDNKTIKNVVGEAFTEYIKRWERKHGPVTG